MKIIPMKSAIAGALVLVAAGGTAQAQDADLEQLKAQLQAMQSKIDELEKQQKAQQEAQDRTTDAVAQSRAAAGGDWASRITWKGDFRYRHENVDPEEAVTDQTRQRIRARFGLTAKITDTVTGTVQLATTGGNSDPRSTNQTLNTGLDRKGVGIDLAYVDWKALSSLNVQLGKMPLPWQRVGSAFFDNDITPEGGALKFARGPFFGSAFGIALSERSTAADATLLGGQLGITDTVGPAKLTGAVGYFDVGSVQGQVTATPNGCTTAFNPAFFGGAQGNTTVTVGGCPVLVNDYNMIHVLGQAEFTLRALPFTVFADFVQNQEASDLDTGYSAGFILGKAGNARTWEVGYMYQLTEKDATFAQFVDSDFGGGITDVRGSTFRLGYAPAKNLTINGTYFLNDRFVDVGTQRDYDRLQIDLNYKF